MTIIFNWRTTKIQAWKGLTNCIKMILWFKMFASSKKKSLIFNAVTFTFWKYGWLNFFESLFLLSFFFFLLSLFLAFLNGHFFSISLFFYSSIYHLSLFSSSSNMIFIKIPINIILIIMCEVTNLKWPVPRCSTHKHT